MTGRGDCFETAWRVARAEAAKHPEDQYRVVHGLVVGTGGDVEGVRFQHAWVERTFKLPFSETQYVEVTSCIDRSNGNDGELLCALYYRTGQVQESTLRRYDTTEAAELLLRHNHYGPWDPYLLAWDPTPIRKA